MTIVFELRRATLDSQINQNHGNQQIVFELLDANGNLIADSKPAKDRVGWATARNLHLSRAWQRHEVGRLHYQERTGEVSGKRRETRDRRQETGDRRKETGDCLVSRLLSLVSVSPSPVSRLFTSARVEMSLPRPL